MTTEKTMLYELLPFLVMIAGILILGIGAIWQITRQYNERGERNRTAAQTMKTTIAILIASALAAHANSHGFLTGQVFESNGPTFADVEVGDQLFGTWAYDTSEADFDLAVMFNTVFTLQTDTYLFYTGPFKPVVDANEVPIAFSMTNWHDWLFSSGGGIWIHEGMDFSTVRATLAFVPEASAQRQSAIPEGGASAWTWMFAAMVGMFVARKL